MTAGARTEPSVDVASPAMTALPGSITMQEAAPALAALRQAFAAEASPVWRIDASALRHLDSAAIAVLLECRRMAAAAGREMVLSGATSRLVDLATLYGVEGLIGAAPAAGAAATTATA